nr:GNAT family N-acetyltransferase [Chloroflexaceae bacterium]
MNLFSLFTNKRRQRANSIVTSKGRRLRVRQATPGDTAALVSLLQRLSPRSRWLRFGAEASPNGVALAQREAARLTEPSHAPCVWLALANDGGSEVVVAIAELAPAPTVPACAEVALLVRDDYQGDGVGTALARLLVEQAQQRGIRTLLADVRSAN